MNGRAQPLWLLALLTLPAVMRADTGSANFRLIAPAPASTAGVGTSPAHRVYIVGGSGQATGLSASPIYSVNAGGTSTQLPTDRLFEDGVE